jgi:hypothetical protein
MSGFGGHIRIWRLMLLASSWVAQGPIRPPGTPKRGKRKQVPCKQSDCHELAIELDDGSFKCPNGHRFNI